MSQVPSLASNRPAQIRRALTVDEAKDDDHDVGRVCLENYNVSQLNPDCTHDDCV